MQKISPNPPPQSPGCPAHSQSVYWLCYPGSPSKMVKISKWNKWCLALYPYTRFPVCLVCNGTSTRTEPFIWVMWSLFSYLYFESNSAVLLGQKTSKNRWWCNLKYKRRFVTSQFKAVWYCWQKKHGSWKSAQNFYSLNSTNLQHKTAYSLKLQFLFHKVLPYLTGSSSVPVLWFGTSS